MRTRACVNDKVSVQIVFIGLCGSAHSFDLEVSEQHTLEFSDWESQDYCIYHGNTELSSHTTYLSRRAQRYSSGSSPLLQCMILHCIA